jgi:hypothetical protein
VLRARLCCDYSTIDRPSVSDLSIKRGARLEAHLYGSIARYAVLAIVVVVVIVVVVAVVVAVVAVVSVTLKICGSEEQTAENRPW